MSSLPKISVMIPTYNQEKFIERTIESVLQQDYPNLEIVISDDNSTDRTSKIVQKFLKDKRIKYYKNKKRLGRVHNYRITLFKRVTGEWVLNLDGDDYLYDSRIISYFANIIKKYHNKKLVAIIGSRIIRYARENYIFCGNPKKFLGFQDGKRIFLNWKKIDFGHSNVLYNVKVAREINFYRVDCLGSDSESFLRLLLHGNVFVSNEVISVWNVHTSNASLYSNLKDYFNNIKCLKYVKNYARRFFNEELLDKWEKEILSIYLRMLVLRTVRERKFLSSKTIEVLSLLRKANIRYRDKLILKILLFIPYNPKIEYVLRKFYWKFKKL